MEWTKELEELYQYMFEQQPSEVEMNQMASEYKEASNG
jgi:Tfp pilus assembly protein PilO